ncbi:hypothetical protein [Brevibacterium oceani]|uniref:hypothetical protein n=1 Tax=Brevibacterium oceani TaxID=358099 RepID=UPI0015E76315|nr:hypothetical protein [Brevibacterium oceani]
MGKKNRKSEAARERLIEKRRQKNAQADVAMLEERVYDPSFSPDQQLSALIESYKMQGNTETERAVEQVQRLRDVLSDSGWKLDLVSHEGILWGAETSAGERSVSTNVLVSEPSVRFEAVEFARNGAIVDVMDIVERVNRCYPDAEHISQYATDLLTLELSELEECLPEGVSDTNGSGREIGVPAQYQLMIPDEHLD